MAGMVAGPGREIVVLDEILGFVAGYFLVLVWTVGQPGFESS